MDSKKRSVGATERDEFLRAAWWALVAGEIYAERLVFLRMRWALTSRWHPCMRGRGGESERSRACRAKLGEERHLALASMSVEGMGP
jgi:hypothetical protein